MNNNVVFCTTCKGRTQHLEQTLPRNLADNADYPACKFIVLDYNSPDHLQSYLQSNHASDISSGRLVVYTMLPPETGPIPFRVAHAKNMAHRCGIMEGADIVVNLDADNYTNYGFSSYLNDIMDGKEYLWTRMVKGKFPRGVNGRIVATTKSFLAVGGYDERFEHWNSDDKDICLRLSKIGEGSPIDDKYLDGIPHNDKVRFRDYPEMKYAPAEYFDITYAGTSVVNFGRIGLGTVYRNFDFDKPIVIGPIATRVFGIGMPKTATTSLNWAFGILGYKSAHWPNAAWAKSIRDELLSTGKSPTLEMDYAVSDIPIPIYYRELDRSYPGSKFILTLMPEDKWIESVRKHFDPSCNPQADLWPSIPIVGHFHAKMYGRKKFDRNLFIERYRLHNESVMDYFKDRPDDLLIMDHHDWPDLCRFLDKPVPSIPYPWKNGSKK